MKEFPPFRLDTVNQCLWRSGTGGRDERVLLTPKAFAVLRILVDHAGRLVSQDELLDAAEAEIALHSLLEYDCGVARDDPASGGADRDGSGFAEFG